IWLRPPPRDMPRWMVGHLRYISTRGGAPAREFEEVLLAGLAEDGGLHVPEQWPHLSPDELAAFAGRPYHEVAAAVMRPFVQGLDETSFARIVQEAYAGFSHRSVAPLRLLGPDRWLMELFHGP